MPVSTRLIINPSAGSASGADLSIAHDAPLIEVVEVETEDQTRDAATEAARDGIDKVVAAGGDGTLHLVANGLMAVGSNAADRPILGVLPLGTGNDFARTLGLPLDDVATCLRCIGEGVHRPLDLIRYSHENQNGYAINVCAGGFSGVVGETLTPEFKASWGPLAYLIGAAKLLPDLTGYHTEIAWDDAEFERVEAYNIVVANGRTAAGGQPVAPRANPEDGLLDVVIIEDVGIKEVLTLAPAALARSDYLDKEGV
ncbi:MAG TPA: YegS/Rv2252/BmrU family lipid kinase, partial [Rubricoccaceae bacterium]